MKKKNQNNDFFMETIDITPSTDIQQQTDCYVPPMPNQDGGSGESIVEERRQKRIFGKTKKIILKSILIFICFYLSFLIFGILKTNYYIDENGIRKPISVTYQDVATKDDYITLKKEFETMRKILTDIRVAEIKYNNGDIDETAISTQFQTSLAQIDVTIPKLQAINLGTKQEPIKQALNVCYSVHLAGYLQDFTKGIATGDDALVTASLKKRELALTAYFEAEKNIKTLADELKFGDDVFFKWTLDSSAEEKDPTAVLKEKK